VSACASRPALLPVALPELSRAASPVQSQLRERFASLQSRLDNPATPPLDLANEFGETGKLFMAAQYRDAAEPCLLNAQALAPGDVRWPYYLAHLYRLRNDPERAATFFEQVLRARPDDVPSMVWLGEMDLLRGRPEAAEPLFANALSRQPRLPAALFGLGRVALARRDYAQAVTYLERALAPDQPDSIVHYPLAMAYRGLGQMDKAEAHLRLRGHVDPAPPDPLMTELNESLQSDATYERLGVDALEKRAWTEAAAYFRKGIELAPDNPSLRQRLGTALFMAGNAAAAEKEFAEAVRRSPDFAKARYSLGVLQLTSGRISEGIVQLSAAVREDPTYLEARLRLAEALRQGGRLDDSLSEYEKAIRMDPRSAEATFGVAVTLVRLRRYQAARDRLVEGMQVYPAQPAFAHALARLLAAAPDDRVRNGRQAVTLTQQLLKQQKQTLDLGETMAMALAEVGQYDQAITLQREVVAAVSKSGRQDVVAELRQNLALYERHKPCRTPLRSRDPVEDFGESGMKN
jgi:tetratricopeptide (TPR) repeat protein